MIAPLLLLACTRPLPTALRPDPVMEGPALSSDGSLSRLVGADPLLRRPRADLVWRGTPEEMPILAWQAMARRAGTSAADWHGLERGWPGTVAVPLARGARLAALEALTGEGRRPEDELRRAALLLPLAESERPESSAVGSPLSWVRPGSEAADLASLLVIAERQVLSGWMDGPGISLAEVSAAMRSGPHDRLRASPTGALLLARAAGARDPEAAAAGRQSLEDATALALAQARADGPAEHEELARRLRRAAQALSGSAEPATGDAAISALLERARARLTADAEDDESAGLALVAITAQRWRGECPDAPCTGMDRGRTLHASRRFGPRAQALALAWQVIFLKQALDGVEASQERLSFGARLGELIDALLADPGWVVDPTLLQQPRPTPATFLRLGRAVGVDATTEARAAFQALRDALRARCDEALASTPPPALAVELEALRAAAARP